ncbi:MAG: DUF1992 domain-containing protein [Desulfobacterales bacterium]|nr:DUF1992 domain-containing protein [Desulfobacterales bacterium]
MIPGFEQIVEERIRQAQQNGAFDDLEGAGKPLVLEDMTGVPEELRLAYKVLKNADCTPPELQLKDEIFQTEQLLAAMEDTREKYQILKKLNFLIMKFNAVRGASMAFELPQRYEARLVDRFGQK